MLRTFSLILLAFISLIFSNCLDFKEHPLDPSEPLGLLNTLIRFNNINNNINNEQNLDTPPCTFSNNWVNPTNIDYGWGRGLSIGNSIIISRNAGSSFGANSQARSLDGGDSWELFGSINESGWRFIVGNSERLVAVNNSPSSPFVAYSSNLGVSFTYENFGFVADNRRNWLGLARSEMGTLVASGIGGRVMRSTDNGASWSSATLAQSGFTGDISDIVFANERFVAAESAGRLIYSEDDGLSWSTAADFTDGTNRVVSRLVYGNGLFVAVYGVFGGDMLPAVAYSTDGVSWTLSDFQANFDFSSLAYGNGRFLAIRLGIDENQIFESKDGNIWDVLPHPNGSIMDFRDVIFANNRFFVSAGFGGTANQRFMYLGCD